MTTKTCSQCGQTKNVNDFHSAKSTSDGKRSNCKECVKSYTKKYYKINAQKCRDKTQRYREVNPEKVKESKQKYIENNTERISEQRATIRLQNKDQIDEYNYEYYHSNQEREKARAARYREENPEKVKEAQRKWREENPEKARESSNKSKARKYANDPRYQDDIKERNSPEANAWRQKVLDRDDHTCIFCGEKGVQAHHLNGWKAYPKQRYDIPNGISLCWECHSGEEGFHANYGKGNNTREQFIEWMENNGLPIPSFLD